MTIKGSFEICKILKIKFVLYISKIYVSHIKLVLKKSKMNWSIQNSLI